METKRRYGIVTQTKYYNFVNFGAMLQCYALQQALNKLGVDNTVVDYRTDPLLLTDIDDPLKSMQDSRFLSRLAAASATLQYTVLTGNLTRSGRKTIVKLPRSIPHKISMNLISTGISAEATRSGT